MNDWNNGKDGYNLKFKRETLLNYAMNRWQLNRPGHMGTTSALIRKCAPNSYQEWVDFYFENAVQKKKNGEPITQAYLRYLGEQLYLKLSETVHNELANITEEECIDYVYNLVINRTYEGYRTEIETIYRQLERALGYKIEAASDEWDRTYAVDFYIAVDKFYIGIQIKPISARDDIDAYKWMEQHRKNHQRFTQEMGGAVFFVYSKNVNGKKEIVNKEVIDEINNEIEKLNPKNL